MSGQKADLTGYDGSSFFRKKGRKRGSMGVDPPRSAVALCYEKSSERISEQ